MVVNFTYVEMVHLYDPDATGSCRIRAISPTHQMAVSVTVGIHSMIKTRVTSIPFYRALALSPVPNPAVQVASIT